MRSSSDPDSKESAFRCPFRHAVKMAVKAAVSARVLYCRVRANLVEAVIVLDQAAKGLIEAVKYF